MIIYGILKFGGNDNSSNSLNVIEYYHYHGENSVITQQFPYIVVSASNILDYQREV